MLQKLRDAETKADAAWKKYDGERAPSSAIIRLAKVSPYLSLLGGLAAFGLRVYYGEPFHKDPVSPILSGISGFFSCDQLCNYFFASKVYNYEKGLQWHLGRQNTLEKIKAEVLDLPEM